MSASEYSYESISYIDDSLERAAVKFPLVSTYTGPQELALRNATNNLTDMTLAEYNIVSHHRTVDPVPAGHREEKLLVRAHDPSTGQKFSFSIPGFDNTIVMLPDSDFADLTDVQVAAFVTAFEACVANPVGDTLLDVDSIERTRGKK